MKKEESRFTSGTLFEGMTSIRSVIYAANGGISDRRIIRILVDSERCQSRGKELAWLRVKSRELGFSIEMTTADEIDALTTGNTHGGIVAECTERTIPELTDFEVKTGGFYVMIEGIEDPYNFGYALRSLYACGADGVVLSPRNWMSAAGVVCRSSAGASELLPVYISDGVSAADYFRDRGYKIACAGIRDSVSSFDADMTCPIFLIVGGEKRGISASLLEKADQIVRIDYGRDFGGSLSAASAASMLAYEVMRQNKK
ncbi:MAG: RNA methyltransferase [Ruminococcaceae bacterium]|nr:RNA methyltransferase [Oscillospiraceae bacterium]